MLDFKSKLNLPVRLLSVAFLIGLTISCKGQETENEAKEKVESRKPQNDEYQPLIYTRKSSNSIHHSTLNGIVSEFVWQIHEDKKGNYWFGTNHDGVVIYNNNLLKQFTSKDGIGGNAVRAIVEDDRGNIWLGTSNGITSYNGEKFTNYTTKNGLIDNEIWAIEIDTDGTIWIGTVGGVSKFDGTNFETFKIPKPDVSNPEPMLSKNRVSEILIDKNGHFWFVNDSHGITKFNGSQFEFLTIENGLTDNNVADLFQDSQGNIWIGIAEADLCCYVLRTPTPQVKCALTTC
jgi:ligand-binding sensor domain-containing protein